LKASLTRRPHETGVPDRDADFRKRPGLLGQANGCHASQEARRPRATDPEPGLLGAEARGHQDRRRAVDRSQKAKLVDGLHQALSDTVCVVVTHQNGMTVEEVTTLRRQMRAVGAGFKVTKNRLARRALEGTKCEQLASLFKG